MRCSSRSARTCPSTWTSRPTTPAGSWMRCRSCARLPRAVPVLGRRVAVYGGGNTAMDAARTARRLGAEDTLIVYRRTRAQMPAHEEEAAEAEREGVRINWLHTITAESSMGRADRRGHAARRARLSAAHRPAGDIGRRHADPGRRPRRRHRVPPDQLRGVEFKRDGTVVASASMMTCSSPGVFAGGDMVPAERTVTVGVGHGKKAARFIDAYLRDTEAAQPAQRGRGRVRPAAPVVPHRRLPAGSSPSGPRPSGPADFAEIVSGL